MPETITPKARLVFKAVSAVMLFAVSGCVPADKEVGLCTYLGGCGSGSTAETDPTVQHDNGPMDYGTFDPNDYGDDGTDTDK